ncbi:dihydroorotate dehydrogenase [Deinobacterium chartae]|uniref:Dihydroorotate dehydrogenase (quinone) n=1 Tax=Deinobacterium chartae TaxID=521158 RepID=A0A841I1N9_9DEIO|nr:quinone-dependent dihydroorotate dehydrogenase [Deinobacterium chartae]MBB6098904.1 dihydroorotate dehydrogenase [Deinobacterium chartae]
MYALIKPLLFRFDPEEIHELVMGGLVWTDRTPLARDAVSRLGILEDARLTVRRFGLAFPNPVGLAAGFDKNARAVRAWRAMGFGAVEVGTVTPRPQPGNDRPRLFRLPRDRALINRMGFNNDGSEAVATRLRALRAATRLDFPVGVNVGKNKDTPLAQAPADYAACLRAFADVADYFVLNVSSPNTPGLRQLQDRAALEELLSEVARTRATLRRPVPVLLKIAPDLGWEAIDEALTLLEAHALDGIIATNTTLSRAGLSADPGEAGGLSGAPLKARALEVLRHLRARLGDRLPIVSVGGIETPQDAVQRLRAGASLLQVYTGFIYQGPLLVRAINAGILAELEREGMPHLEHLIGADVR